MPVLRFTSTNLAALVTLIVLSCGEKKPLPEEPLFLPESKDAFIGQWNGNVEGAMEVRELSETPGWYTVDDMSCQLKFTQSRYELVLHESQGNRETTYRQTGRWSWSDNYPLKIVFYEDSISSLVQSLSLVSGVATKKGYYGPIGEWSCYAIFEDESFSSMKLNSYVREPCLIDLPGNIPIMLSR